jgi:hypothetical protein
LEHSKISQDLSQQFSGNIVKRQDNLVYKFGATIITEKIWYYAADPNCIFTPKTYQIDDLLLMDYVESVGPIKLDQVIKLVETYKTYPVLGDKDFTEYRQRIAHHLLNNNINGGMKLNHLLNQIDLWPTFAHGDLSIRNIIQAATGPKLIDPLYGLDRFGSFILDYAKLAFTLKFFNNDIEGYETIMHHAEVQPVLIASECVRVATYNKRFNFIAENLIDEL